MRNEANSVQGKLSLFTALLVLWMAPHFSHSSIVAADSTIPDETRERDSEEYRKEYGLKAAYIYNFANFVEWPTESFENQNSPIIVGIVGEDPFGKILEQTLDSRKVGKRNFLIQRYSEWKELEQCHILFVSSSERNDVERILAFCSKKSVFIVSEMEGMIGKGGIANFFVENRSLRFEIQIDEAKRSKLQISSKLLKLARIVRDEDLR